MLRIAAPLSLVILSACSAIQPAQMRLPASLAVEQERIPFEDMSGWSHGRFTAGDYRGGYERSLDRLSLMGLFSSTAGHAEFVLEGPGISSTIEGRCRVREGALTFDDIEFKPGKMAYRCDMTADGLPFPARFEVRESRKGVDALTRNARRGEVAIAGQIVGFRSVHDVQGGVLPTEDPIGYVFEQDGRAIGALELNGKPVLILPQGTDIDRRRAMMLASVALATFWDPAAVDS